MRSVFSLVILVVLSAGTGMAQTGNSVDVAGDGWTITAASAQGIITVAHDRVGTVMQNVHLNLWDKRGLRPWRKWSAEKRGDRELSVRTVDPSTEWRFAIGLNELRVSTTTWRGELTAEVPAPPNRMVARTLDPEGTPVSWVATNEVEHAFGGTRARNQSYLPRKNPECMYFALGQVSSTDFHSLFDRGTDTVISFSDQALMQRNSRDKDRLDVTLPVQGNTMIRLISFADKLGLNADASYVAFDFWNQKLLGTFKDRLNVEVGPHDTRVILIHPLMNRPQLVGTSSHITGAHSILNLGWDGSHNLLRGSSRTVPGEVYTLWLYVPNGVTISHTQATTLGNRKLAVRQESAGNSLSVSFPGQQDKVDWEIHFAPQTTKAPQRESGGN